MQLFVGNTKVFFEPKQCSGSRRIFQLLYLELEVQSGHLCDFKLMTVLTSKYLLNDFLINVSFLFIRNVPFDFDNSLFPPLWKKRSLRRNCH